MAVPLKPITEAVTQALKTARTGLRSAGDRKRWSIRNTVSGVLVGVVAEQAVLNGLTWEGVALAFCAVLPLSLSVLKSK
jgi:hypothetical protein